MIAFALDGAGGLVYTAFSNAPIRRLKYTGGQWVGSRIAGIGGSSCSWRDGMLL